MPKQAAQNLHETEQRIGLQIAKIRKLEGAGRWPDARHARETLAVITETRDALRLRLKVVTKVVATEAREACRARPVS